MSQEKQIAIEERFAKVFNDNSFKERLSSTDFERYLNAKKKLSFQKHDIIFDDGEIPKGVYVLEKGAAKLSKSGSFGKDQILRFIKEGDIIGYRALLCGENFQAKAEAMTEVECTFLPADIFMDLLEVDPKLSFIMLQKISYELGESSNTITFLAQKTVRERLAEILILLEQKLGTDPEGFIKISLTREEIANIIGTATESAIRLISEFKQDSLIEVDGRNIKILNHDKLMKLGHVVL
ncbi:MULTISPECIES: Crp/Fnr family transcriptional regulator [Chryseobacterium]|jgi:CRP-like cAMP-binding protein|uniref:Crp/Fnr family transcriptional regulator n=2 Tax=Chryseobacterium aquaticum TaxID=452084 RepID=A0A0Q3PB19_9FLAO|nr:MULTISPECIES: Crp/Fnr family transcriptional regulator [Chryseobacterium]KNB61982.1 Crp/Fnr family transcriptional regulator [Chryseobacterium sp. Hurlbut01]KQK26838.1 Crp/Fnr family transcriptional regulator [Chryseobacterium aquaticum]KUJ57422.1 Crp/Fnr family transcriptional regulator [Chryseobacterium aquaticum subsp. greenlandense]NMR35060.1 Crp/Fnr family transcriptional regulator [Chryseobacterium aquaticum]NRQ47076.1 Crp/Fnr family transcriptional regulator [Chryseobacterium sp. C-2